MRDFSFIAATMRDIGASWLTAAQIKSIMASPEVTRTPRDDVDVALRRRAIVAATLRVLGSDADPMDVYGRVWIACRNAEADGSRRQVMA